MAHLAFPDVTGNYIELADTTGSPLDVGTDLTLIVRVRVTTGKTGTGNRFWVRKGAAYGLAYQPSSPSAGFVGTVRPAAVGFDETYHGASNPVGAGWKWFAVTYEGNNGASGRTARLWTAPDSADWPDDGDWTQIGSDFTTAGASDVTSNNFALRSGNEIGINASAFDLSHIAVRAGIGVGGIPGGTPRLHLTPEDINIAGADPATIEAETGQVFTVIKTGAPYVVVDSYASGESLTDGWADPPEPAEAYGESITYGLTPWDGVPSDRGMPACKVEATIGQPFNTPLLDRVWTRIDDVCCVRQIKTREGKEQRIADQLEPGEYEILFDNRSAAMDPTNDQSPWWTDGQPGIDYGTWMRVTLYETDADLVADVNGRVQFVAMTQRMFPEWKLTDATMRVELVDALAVLAGHDLGPSALYHSLLADPVVESFWPLADAGTVIADAKGVNPGTWSGAGVATESGFLELDRSPASVAVDAVTGTMVVGTLGSTAPTRWTFAVWVLIDPTDTADGDALFRIKGPTHSLTVTVNMPSGTLKFAGTGASPDNSGKVVADGQPHLIRVHSQAPGYSLWIDNSMNDTSIGASQSTTPTGLTLDTVELGGSGAVAAAKFQYAALANLQVDPTSLLYQLPLMWGWTHTPWAGEMTDERFERICDLAGVGHAVSGTGFKLAALADVAAENALGHITKAASGDGATISVDHDAGGIVLYRIVDPDEPVAWFDTAGTVAAPAVDLAPVYGIDRLAGRVEVEWGNGSTAVAVPSPQRYPSAPLLSLATVLQLRSDAQSRADTLAIERGKPRQLTPRLGLVGRDIRVPWDGLFMRPGDRAGVIAHPTGRAEFVQVSSVEQVEHELDWQTREWRVSYSLDRVVQWITWQDVYDTYATWSAVMANFATWADLFGDGTPNPPPPDPMLDEDGDPMLDETGDPMLTEV